MPKQFNKDKKYVFTKKKFIKDQGRKAYRDFKEWVDRCNGRNVTIENRFSGIVDGFSISSAWCKEVSKH